MKRFVAITHLLTACGAGSDGRTEVLVSAASSLTDVFGEIEVAYEAAHPGVDVVLKLGASSTLAAQIVEGAPVDVFASADTATMSTVVAAGLADGDRSQAPTATAAGVRATGSAYPGSRAQENRAGARRLRAVRSGVGR